MDCDICFLCHSHIDFARLSEAYPHLCEDTDSSPPQGLSHLEEKIWWGDICVECAQKAEAPPQEAPRFRDIPSAQRLAGRNISFPGSS